MTLHIACAHLDRIEALAAETFPEEACGLLVGHGEAGGTLHVSAVHPSRNVAADRASRFEVDPALRFRLQRDLRGAPERVVGVFHSHPNGDPAPSETDRASVYEPDLVWLITAASSDRPAISRAWAIDMQGDKATFRAIPLETSD